jgi:hypothetical protein
VAVDVPALGVLLDNAWDPVGLQREIDMCIHRGAVCDLASNRAEEFPFVAP